MPEYAIEAQINSVAVVEADSLEDAMAYFNGSEELHGEMLANATPEIVRVEDNSIGDLLYVKEAVSAPMEELALRLESGVSSDIFYDADDYGDDNAQEIIEDFQCAVGEAVLLLRNWGTTIVKSGNNEKSLAVARAAENRCPFCYSTDVEYEGIDAKNLTQDASCNDCNQRWTECLAVVGIIEREDDE